MRITVITRPDPRRASINEANVSSEGSNAGYMSFCSSGNRSVGDPIFLRLVVENERVAWSVRSL